MRDAERGITLVELVVVMAIVALAAAVGLPRIFEATAALRVRAAAGEIVSIFHLARGYAVAHSANVGVRFETGGARVTWSLYRDGDGDGVRGADIERGIDPPVFTGRAVGQLGTSVRFGFPPGPAPRDPGDPRRRLDRLDDPIRFNRSDIASFDPLGGSTPGSVYLTDGRRELAAVRVVGRSGKTRVLVYDPAREAWSQR
jgi:type IV fimbrial biogenesis protein FimT